MKLPLLPSIVGILCCFQDTLVSTSGITELCQRRDPHEDFDIEDEPFASGAFSQVFGARSKRSIFVLKKLDMEKLDTHELYHEVDILSTVKHPNIVKYYDCYEWDGQLWIRTEYLKGITMMDLVFGTNSPQLEFPLIVYIMKSLVETVKSLHDQGIMHRDLQAKNIIITTKGEVKIIDFGRSVRMESPESTYIDCVGAPAYMAPEVAINDEEPTPYGVASEVWSLGLLLYGLTEGGLPEELLDGPLGNLIMMHNRQGSDIEGPGWQMSGENVKGVLEEELNFLQFLLERATIINQFKRLSVENLLECLGVPKVKRGEAKKRLKTLVKKRLAILVKKAKKLRK